MRSFSSPFAGKCYQKLVLTGCTVYTPDQHFKEGTVIIEEGNIVYAGPADKVNGSSFTILKLAPELIVCPGLIDLHIHGCKGYAVSSDPKEITGLSRSLAGQGVTGFLATTFTASLEELAEIIRTANNLKKEELPGADVLGVHLEGPFLNPDYAGAHNLNFIRPPSIDDLRFLLQNGGQISILTLAPELPGALETIRYAAEHSIVTGAGHSEATYEEALEAFSAGLTYATHVFNRMSPLHHRRPGLTGAVLTHPQIWVEAIADGVHIHTAIIKLLAHTKKHKLILVSDNVPPAGLPEGEYKLGHQNIMVSREAVWNSEKALVGSNRPLSYMVSRVKEAAELSLKDVLPFVTIHPAQVLKIDHKTGRLAPGFSANLAVFTRDLQPLLTIKQGSIVFCSPDFVPPFVSI